MSGPHPKENIGNNYYIVPTKRGYALYDKDGKRVKKEYRTNEGLPFNIITAMPTKSKKHMRNTILYFKRIRANYDFLNSPLSVFHTSEGLDFSKKLIETNKI